MRSVEAEIGMNGAGMAMDTVTRAQLLAARAAEMEAEGDIVGARRVTGDALLFLQSRRDEPGVEATWTILSDRHQACRAALEQKRQLL